MALEAGVAASQPTGATANRLGDPARSPLVPAPAATTDTNVGMTFRHPCGSVLWGARCGKTARRVLPGGRGGDSLSLPDPLEAAKLVTGRRKRSQHEATRHHQERVSISYACEPFSRLGSSRTTATPSLHRRLQVADCAGGRCGHPVPAGRGLAAPRRVVLVPARRLAPRA